ncbi:hypothetical protein KY495_22295 [Massilia sp. PAMC28688]|uniref:hypothetical protein n=1 Tax=Massilia sp. PAMC28688 TaxID=2861283 RepID=UPI001C635DB1|nr:hypothetical protein [Massilia sp. PAMC28688]QYF93367.1 hypothetical protein KY495_22295 [Massilia sp. PAMC28688]
MFGLFKRAPVPATRHGGALGMDTLALRMAQGAIVPASCMGVSCDAEGTLSRIAPGARFPAGEAWCFHPGPYTTEFAPFAASPELGLQLSFVIDAPDPRVAQQRFDLYLVSEGGERVTKDDFAALIGTAVQRELAQGNLELPPCTTPEEWDAFRAGLNRLLYQRFGITVDDCIPVDLGEKVDYARLLRESASTPAVLPAPGADRVARAPAAADALALRRLFLELPALASALRQLPLPEGQGHFQRQQLLLQRLDHVALTINTMPALGLVGPGRKLDAAGQAIRAQASEEAALALDEAWSLLARLAHSPAALLDDADRIAANLELHCATRRATP